MSGTPLHVAASKGFCTGMMMLINAGANINSYNRSSGICPSMADMVYPAFTAVNETHKTHKTYKTPQLPKRVPADSMRILSDLLVLPAASSMASSGSPPIGSPCIRSSSQAQYASAAVSNTSCHSRCIAQRPSASASARTGYGSAVGSIGGRWRETKRGNFQNGCVQKHISPRTARFISSIRERGANARLFQDPQTSHHNSLPCIRPRRERPDFFRIHNIPPQVLAVYPGAGSMPDYFRIHNHASWLLHYTQNPPLQALP